MNLGPTFAHHDRIAKAKAGDVLIVCEPIEATNIREGGVFKLPVGQMLRVTMACAGLWCETEIAGRIRTAVIDQSDFTALDMPGEKRARALRAGRPT